MGEGPGVGNTPRSTGGRLGVFWHTQGSGKSVAMMFFAQKVLRKIPGNWTFVVVTDRQELDGQIYKHFASAGVVTRRPRPGGKQPASAAVAQRGSPLRLHADPQVSVAFGVRNTLTPTLSQRERER